MKCAVFLAFTVALCTLSFATTETKKADPSTDINNPIYKGLGIPKDEEIVRIKPVGEDTILLEGPEHEIEAKADGGEEAVTNELPVSHDLDHINLPEAEIEPAAVKLVNVKEEAKPAGLDVSAKGYRRSCPKKCKTKRHSCPYGCKAKYCVIKKKYPYRKKYIVKKKYVVKYRRRVYVGVKKCLQYVKYYTKYGYRKKCKYYSKGYYKWVVYYKTKYRYVTKYKTIYKYTYKYGLKCKSY